MSVKIIFYELNQPDTSPSYKEFIKYLMGLDDWAQPLSSVWVVDTPKSAQVIRDEAKQFITEEDKLFVAEWYPGSGWASRNLPNVAAEWIRTREGEENVDQYKLPPSMIPPNDPDYTPPPPPAPSQDFLEARGVIPPEGSEEEIAQPEAAETGQTAETAEPATDTIDNLPAPGLEDQPVNPAEQTQTIAIEHEETPPANPQSDEPPAGPSAFPPASA